MIRETNKSRENSVKTLWMSKKLIEHFYVNKLHFHITLDVV